MQYPQGIRILIVEDNVINQILFTKMLSVLGYQADVSESGTQALEACCSQQYDIVFMDYQMPGIDGVEAAKAIKSIDRNPKPVIILMTANLLVNNDYLMHPGIIDGFLKKPFTIQEIKTIIEKSQPLLVIKQASKKWNNPAQFDTFKCRAEIISVLSV